MTDVFSRDEHGHEQRHRLRRRGDPAKEAAHHRPVDNGRQQRRVCDTASGRRAYHLLRSQGIGRRRLHGGGGVGPERVRLHAQG